MSSLVITIKSDRTGTDLADKLMRDGSEYKEGILGLSRFLEAVAGGCEHADIDAQYSANDPVAASQTITCTQSAATADDKVTLLGIDLVAKASGANGTTEFNIGADDDALAANLAACINANATLSALVTAKAEEKVITVTAKVKGVIGNYLKATTVTVDSGTPFVLSNSGAFTGGTGGAASAAESYDGAL